MILVAYWSLLFCLLLSLFAGAAAAYQAWQGKGEGLVVLEYAHHAVAAVLTVASAILFAAFVGKDFSFKYVAEYSNSVLPLFYSVTAFWAGQEGSLLFWAWTVALMGSVFPLTKNYRELAGQTRVMYWLFFFLVQGFFMLALTNWNNPFIEFSPAPADGRGLNPLLQNPGMIFHPPLLFLGYGGFTIPACLALAAWLTGERRSWLDMGRNWAILSWIFLTAGIVLGAWWSYMELGWGGYWAWDPVENASLIPWLSATAFLHTALIEERRGALRRTNVVLVTVTLVLCYFATYLVRSGVVQSLHAFGAGGIGGPLLAFIASGLIMTALVVAIGRGEMGRELSGLYSRPGFLVLTAWLLLAIGGVILMGTMWPVISSLWSSQPIGLDAHFYNRVTLPLFLGIAALLLVCPWLQWREGLRDRRGLGIAVGVFVAAIVALALGGMTKPLAMAGTGLAAACLAGVVLVVALDASVRRRRSSLGAWGVHFGLGLVVLGVAVSGPYQFSREAVLQPGDSMDMGGYTMIYEGFEERSSEAMILVEAKVRVEQGGELVGMLRPQRRLYQSFDQPFAEVSTVFSLGTEVYATLLGVTQQGAASLKFSLHPLVNWIWIGGTLMCLAGFLALRSRSGRPDDAPTQREQM
ncbi:heme lyase CcmF/NrfE family subunit [Desulfocurvibacter africanus]|uniref:Cytochrome c assembly protein n=1 Tax=Desulfocurvibacter africanus subsp. africanus str. Walvis Bay TaxID=690850 RepID=F3Z3S6_DESAF|nr:cytochrome c-type biogenesis CcmF C-terminal domain-containing protein [Desulfocurvibacter africanus]EGJ51541.1 cytochrome c assembly protein [Desulfocurvibacter africanus subsp. africanus str. Walvis Bay]